MARTEGAVRVSDSGGGAPEAKFEFVSVPLPFDACGLDGDGVGVVDVGAGDDGDGSVLVATAASSVDDDGNKGNPLETSLAASYGFVLENDGVSGGGGGGGEVTTATRAQISLQNSVQLAMGTYYDNVNVICGNGGGNPVCATSTDFFIPYLSYEGGFGAGGNQLNYISIAFPQRRDVNEAPEYIDISEMPVALRDTALDKNAKNEPQHQQCEQKPASDGEKTPPGGADDDEDEDDDDVIFVGAYSGNAEEAATAAPVKPKAANNKSNQGCARGGARKRLSAAAVAERKNPKRMTRSCRASESLALKLSIPQQVFNAKIARGANKQPSGAGNQQQAKNLRPTNRPSSANDKDGEDGADEENASNNSSNKENKVPARKKPVAKKPKPTGRVGGRRKLHGNARSRVKEKQLRKKDLENLVFETLEVSSRFVEQMKLHNEMLADVQEEKKQANLDAALDIFADSFVLCSIVKDVDQMELLQSLVFTGINEDDARPLPPAST